VAFVGNENDTSREQTRNTNLRQLFQQMI